jgi:HlyD family secretion protein
MRFVRRHFILITVVLLVVAGLVYAFMPQPVAVDTARVQRGDLMVTVDEDGVTRVRYPYVVSASLEGRLQRINWKPGQIVEQWRTELAVIEPPYTALLDDSAHKKATAHRDLMRDALKRSEEHLKLATRQHETASTRFQRSKDLLPIRGVSRDEFDRDQDNERLTYHELEKAKFSREMAAFDLKMAEAALERTRPRSPNEPHPSAFRILSPISGKVLKVHQISERSVRPETELVEVGDPTDLEIVVDVLSADAVKIRSGQTVWLEHWGGEERLRGEVFIVEPKGFMKRSALGVEEWRVNVIVNLKDPPEKRPTLGDEFRVEARIVLWEGKDVLKVPAGALFRVGKEWAVFVVQDGRAKQKLIKVGHSNGIEAEVLEGLDKDDEVIQHPGDKIKDGVKVERRG